uniref:Uncharacterized protein n=1 Tax=Solanum tuberosum TaxID=4113 RepID=M1CUL4_SOLTU
MAKGSKFVHHLEYIYVGIEHLCDHVQKNNLRRSQIWTKMRIPNCKSNRSYKYRVDHVSTIQKFLTKLHKGHSSYDL